MIYLHIKKQVMQFWQGKGDGWRLTLPMNIDRTWKSKLIKHMQTMNKLYESDINCYIKKEL